MWHDFAFITLDALSIKVSDMEEDIMILFCLALPFVYLLVYFRKRAYAVNHKLNNDSLIGEEGFSKHSPGVRGISFNFVHVP